MFDGLNAEEISAGFGIRIPPQHLETEEISRLLLNKDNYTATLDMLASCGFILIEKDSMEDEFEFFDGVSYRNTRLKEVRLKEPRSIIWHQDPDGVNILHVPEKYKPEYYRNAAYTLIAPVNVAGEMVKEGLAWLIKNIVYEHNSGKIQNKEDIESLNSLGSAASKVRSVIADMRGEGIFTNGEYEIFAVGLKEKAYDKLDIMQRFFDKINRLAGQKVYRHRPLPGNTILLAESTTAHMRYAPKNSEVCELMSDYLHPLRVSHHKI